MRIFTLLCAIILSTTGCGEIIGNQYYVVIDPAFSEANKTDIVNAVHAWKFAVKDLTISAIYVARCNAAIFPMVTSGETSSINAPNPGNDREICIHASNLAEISSLHSTPSGSTNIGITFRHASDDSADVYVATDYVQDDQSMQQLATHEIGHAMGLQHTQPNTIMFWTNSSQTLTPACADISQWLSIRGIDEKDPVCPNGGAFSFFHN